MKRPLISSLEASSWKRTIYALTISPRITPHSLFFTFRGSRGHFFFLPVLLAAM